MMSLPPPFQRLPDFLKLMRLDRPIGTWLLMWPTLAALFLASNGQPERSTLIIFILGVYVMRAAGCVINDYADRNFDGHVERTRARPLATGRISAREALILFAALLVLAFVLVCFTNAFTIWLSLGAAALAAIYPFMKRYTHFPQAVLGAAFGWGIPMAFGAVQESVPAIAWWLFFANVAWTLVYDTQYAMVDRNDDLKVGIKSTAVLFGAQDRLIIGLLQLLVLGLLFMLGLAAGLDGFYWLGLVGIAVTFLYQQQLTWTRTREGCFKAFLNNHWSGVLLFAGIALSVWP
ncbi:MULTISPECIES: 4-hydroxybenzoate octaprenyltransferase [Larsenimonas]|uniref:4-hydroxybenzoate octaprenyltransferase n=1 Tax=Larsenimonas suaedae TaxID=1851019 RepID=A0ABU1GVS7_9GAMM|nr:MULTISPECIES: 4-hydroxybenzoate octaprenyltransferase [Larsenimonas]MCM2973252.1 4-hydroxybenzoate octaprenyltransferase [Larsenimonas suaedae]MCM5705679.1 4-hydroxybenzoate octaprenyltransferase [Larsenimonas salina]MDR5896145.1 4-hydroxybenzoate octaprenyltransferase [Larsenimonas suaedae]